jgi:hypothetical protein
MYKIWEIACDAASGAVQHNPREFENLFLNLLLLFSLSVCDSTTLHLFVLRYSGIAHDIPLQDTPSTIHRL